MKADFSGIDLRRLAAEVHAAYGISISRLTFVPFGEVAASYIAESDDDTRYFVRALKTGDPVSIELAGQVTGLLRRTRGLSEVVAPLANRQGALTFEFGGFVVVVYPYVAGTRAYDVPLTEDGLARMARLIAAIHQTAIAILPPGLYREAFDNPFEQPIRAALDRVERLGADANEYKRRLADLLRKENVDLLDTLRTMQRFGEQARELGADVVLTHGDPNLANILVDATGAIHLIDWDEIGLGPRERDLDFFTGERFEAFLRSYLAAVGPVALHQELFAFYKDRWALQEIADYATRILFHHVDPSEDRHAWDELLPYLPIPHATIAAEVREIGVVLARVGASV